MKRYLVVFIDEEGTFCIQAVNAQHLSDALIEFAKLNYAYSDIYSVTQA